MFGVWACDQVDKPLSHVREFIRQDAQVPRAPLALNIAFRRTQPVATGIGMPLALKTSQVGEQVLQINVVEERW